MRNTQLIFLLCFLVPGAPRPSGRGVTELYNVPLSDVDILTISMAHALASVGGLCVGISEVSLAVFMQHLINAYNRQGSGSHTFLCYEGRGPSAAFWGWLLLFCVSPAFCLISCHRLFKCMYQLCA